MYRLDRLGRYYLENGAVDQAIAVFEMNVEAYPDSARVYNRLGEALLRAGRTEAAIEAFRESIALDPGERNDAHELLEEVLQ